MAQQGGFLFRIGYYLYVNTRLGSLYHGRDIRSARTKYPDGHSLCSPYVCNDLRILPIPIALDNYAYCITDTRDNTTVLVDPSDSEAVQKTLSSLQTSPVAILTTHKHWDHSGGNEAFRRHHPDLDVHGSSQSPGVTIAHKDDGSVTAGRLTFRVLQTPGHTTDHIVYVLDGTPFGAPGSLFSGDLLFLGGIGRIFECPALTMLGSLERVTSLTDDTLVWPGHEYTRNNLQFAKHLEPTHEPAVSLCDWAEVRRKESLSTVPGTIGAEKRHNPFLRTEDSSLQKTLGVASAHELTREQRADMLLELRKRKDAFKYIQ